MSTRSLPNNPSPVRGGSIVNIIPQDSISTSPLPAPGIGQGTPTSLCPCETVDIPGSLNENLNAPSPAWIKYNRNIAVVILQFLRVISARIYVHLLLRLPMLYFSRVAQIFEDSDLTLGEIKKMALDAAFGAKHSPVMTDHYRSYNRMDELWNSLLDNLMRDWNTYNIVSTLLLGAILTILQIDAAAQDPIIRYSLLFSQVCTLTSLLFGCLFSVRFDSSMRKTYKAAEWALEAQNANLNLWWNIWILLAMPAVWLGWSIIFYVIGIMAFVWRTSTDPNMPPPAPISSRSLLFVRILISLVLGLGAITGALSLRTFNHYGQEMDKSRKRNFDERAQSGNEYQGGYPLYVYQHFHPSYPKYENRNQDPHVLSDRSSLATPRHTDVIRNETMNRNSQ